MLKDLFDQQQRYLNHFFSELDHQSVDRLLKVMLECSGMIFFTGVGKSGIIAKKIAMTMMSTGTRSLYLSPTNALHGDLGIVRKNDVFILLSRSGESDELFSLIPFLRNRGAYLVAAVCKEGSRLSKACDMTVILPLEKELCPFGLAPTTSTAIQLIFGDALAIAMMRSNKFSLDEYALNHPAGNIGKQLSLHVRDLMISGEKVPTCRTTDKLVDVLVELSNKRCGCVLVTDEKKQLQGIFTDGDLRRALQAQGSHVLEQAMERLMNRGPRVTNPDTMAIDAMKKMEADQKTPIMVMPVVENGKEVVGIIKMHDIVQSGL